MKMPHAEQAIVDDSKIGDYLLNDHHEDGKSKSKFFKQFGFDANEPDIFKSELLIHACVREVSDIIETPHGKKFALTCEIKTPDTRNPCIKSIWITRRHSKLPSLVTAYPAK